MPSCSYHRQSSLIHPSLAAPYLQSQEEMESTYLPHLSAETFIDKGGMGRVFKLPPAAPTPLGQEASERCDVLKVGRPDCEEDVKMAAFETRLKVMLHPPHPSLVLPKDIWVSWGPSAAPGVGGDEWEQQPGPMLCKKMEFVNGCTLKKLSITVRACNCL